MKTKWKCIAALCCLLFWYAEDSGAAVVSQGLADLTAWDQREPVRLSGEFEFYWQQQLFPGDFPKAGEEPVVTIAVPGTWNNLDLEGRKLPGEGFATYRLRIVVPEVQPYALKIPDVGTSYRLFADDQLLITVGEPGRTRGSTTARYYPTTVSFVPSVNEFDLIVQVSNFDYRMGGLWLPLLFGTPEQIERVTQRQHSLDMLLFGAILIIGLYNLALFGMRRQDPSSLYLGLFCLLLSVRLLAVGDRFLTRIFDIPFDWYVRIEYLSWILALSAFAGFMRTIVPGEFPKWVAGTMHAGVLAGTLFILSTSVDTFSHAVPPLQLFTIACLIAGSISFGFAIVRKREGALILTLAYVVLFYATLNDILVNAGVVDTYLLLDIGLLVFIFFQSMLISYRFTNSFQLIDNQRATLEAINLRLRTQEKLRRQLENRSEYMLQRMAASEKMETIQTLVAGIRPRIEGFIRVAENQPPAKVMRDLLIMADVESAERAPVDLNSVVTKLAADKLSNTTRHLQDHLPTVWCNREHAHRLVVALVQFFEVHDADDIQIETSFEPMDERSLYFNELETGSYVVLGISGHSIRFDSQDFDRLFSPETSLALHEAHQTGFGLLAVWWLVRELGGGVDLLLMDNHGIRLEIYLPVAVSPPQASSDTVTSPT